MSISVCRGFSLAFLAIALPAATSRADEVDPDLAPATAAFTGRIDRLIEVIRNVLKNEREFYPAQAAATAHLIALHAMHGEGGGGRITRATLFQHALLVADSLNRGKIDLSRQQVEELVKRKPKPDAKMDLDRFKSGLHGRAAFLWFAPKMEGGLGIGEKLQAAASKEKNLQPQDLHEPLLDAAHHTAVIAEFDIGRQPLGPAVRGFWGSSGRGDPQAPEVRKDWELIGQEMRAGAHELIAAVQSRKAPAAAAALSRVQNSCQKCHLQFLVALPIDLSLAKVLDAKKPIQLRTDAVSALSTATRWLHFRGDSKEEARLKKELENRAKAAIPALAETLKVKDIEFREAVMKTLTQMGCPEKTAIAELNEILINAEPYPRFWITHQLRAARTADQAVPLLCDMLTYREPMVAGLALKLLQGEPAPAVTRLQEFLGHADPACRAQAAELLARLGPAAKTAVPVLERAQDDPHASVRLASAQALRAIGSGREITDLVRSLHNADPVVRGQAALALGKLGKSAVPALIQALQSDNRDAQAAAVLALSKIGPDAVAAQAALEKMRQGTDEVLRFAAGQALKKIQPAKE